MAAKKKAFWENWRESYASLIIGAIIVIVLGLLVANFFSKRNQKIDEGEKAIPIEQEATKTPQTYKIAAGDSLSAISKKYYDSDKYWMVLASKNKITNPNRILVDATLEIPPKSEVEKIEEDMTKTSYEVKEGETLFTIAVKVYGDGSRWTVLHAANGARRLPNGNPLVFAGST